MPDLAPSGLMVDAIVQARLGSTRFPRKVLEPVGGEPLLQRVLSRLAACQHLGRVAVATTENPLDDPLVEWCESNGVEVYRGSEEDVLARYLSVAAQLGAGAILRVCSDNPLLDPSAIDAQIEAYREDPSADYVTYVTEDGTPIILKPLGLFAELVTVDALQRVADTSSDPLHRQHVTLGVHERPDSYRVRTLPVPARIDPELRFTIDYPEDVAFCETVIDEVAGTRTEDVAELMKSKPALARENLSFSKAHEKRYR